MGNSTGEVIEHSRHVVQRFLQALVNAALERALGPEEGKRVRVEAYVMAAEIGDKKPVGSLVPAKRVSNPETGETVESGPAAVKAQGGTHESILEGCYIAAAKAYRYFGGMTTSGKPTEGQKKGKGITGKIPAELLSAYDPTGKTVPSGMIRTLSVPVPENWQEACEALLRASAKRKSGKTLTELQVTLTEGDTPFTAIPKVVSSQGSVWESMLSRIASHMEECELAQEEGLSFAFLDMDTVKDQRLVDTVQDQIRKNEAAAAALLAGNTALLREAEEAGKRIAEREAKKAERNAEKEAVSKVANG